jgi:ARG and Rhodanese-Phosphatase-superfamily-associated Protein domain
MRLFAVVNYIALASMLTMAGAATAAPDAVRLSGPFVHDNLAIYLVHGVSREGPVPLTLAEALSDHLAEVRETGSVNSLQIENLSDRPIFVQAGDIVKGGRQDRTLAVSLLLPPQSGLVPIASFCVESGRWTARGGESGQAFASAASAVPSLAMKLAMQSPLDAAAAPEPRPDRHGWHAEGETFRRQERVWNDVAAMQAELSAGAGTDVRAKRSASSLQLALENQKLAKLRAAYSDALIGAGGRDDDIVGYVFAVNGRINSGDVYMSHALFREMWPKMLAAAATEAIGHRAGAAGKPPSIAAVRDFMAAAAAGKMSERDLALGMRRVMHASDTAYLIEADFKGNFVHRSYLAN